MLNDNTGILEHDGEHKLTGALATVPSLLLHSANKYRKPDAFKFKRHGSWVNVSTDEFLLRVEELFFALSALGIKPEDRVAIISENRLEWAIADYAALCAGATTVPVYPTLSAAQMEALLVHSEPVLAFVSGFAQLEKISAFKRPASLRHVISFDSGVHQTGVMGMDAVYNIGRQYTYDYPGEFTRSAKAVQPENVCTIIYTSGTTGVPKGAMLTHRNLTSNIVATSDVLPLTYQDINLSFLPLSHVFQRHVDYASVYAGTTIAYAESGPSVVENLREVRPTFAGGVPRFFEKVYGRIISEVSRGPRFRRAMFDKAMSLGRESVRTGQNLALRAADRLVFKKIRERLGGRIRFFISGGAALEKEIADFFFAAGLPIFEGYGLTETSPVITLNGPAAWRIGTVGKPVGDVQMHIADDGEILVRGSNVMKGYYQMEGETADVLRDGWFHTGDVGDIDPDGFLRITDRKKDLIVTSSGKNVAPQAIENRLRLIPFFDSVVVIGDGRRFISALIVPNYEALTAYAGAHGTAFTKPTELICNRNIYDLAMSEIERKTVDFSPFEKVKKIAFLEREFTIDAGELTPTMKVRRSAIEKKYKAIIDQMYETL